MIEPLPFETHLAELQWKQGEHIFISGTTGSGKTTLARRVVEKRGHVIMFCVKAYDVTIKRDYADFNIVDNIEEVEPWMNRVIVWPRIGKRSKESLLEKQRRVFKQAFNKLLRARGWCVFIDELGYMADPKFGGVGNEIAQMHYIGRSSNLSVVSLAQRPAWVPLSVLSNVSHAYIGRSRLANDAKRLADLGSVDPKELAQVMQSLPTKHDFVYTPTQGEGRPAILNTRK